MHELILELESEVHNFMVVDAVTVSQPLFGTSLYPLHRVFIVSS